jgi:hypothetical protein
MKDKAVCVLCFDAGNKKSKGTIAISTGTTTGLMRHMQHHHRKEYEKIKSDIAKKKINCDVPTKSIKDTFPVQPKEQYFTIDDIKSLYKTAARFWAAEEDVPFNMFTKQSFRNMFLPMNKKADKIINNIKENINLLKKHYSKLRKAEVDRHLHFLVDMEMKFLPELDNDFTEANTDVGQN